MKLFTLLALVLTSLSVHAATTASPSKPTIGKAEAIKAIESITAVKAIYDAFYKHHTKGSEFRNGCPDCAPEGAAALAKAEQSKVVVKDCWAYPGGSTLIDCKASLSKAIYTGGTIHEIFIDVEIQKDTKTGEVDALENEFTVKLMSELND